jgi:DNA-binding transcriptional ArsR family regulator
VPAHRDQTIALGGRGLLLVPSYFCITHPVTLFDGSLPPVLVYPVTRAVQDVPSPARPGRGLAQLIGARRATVLDAISAGATTSEVARRTGVSLAGASEHATILRNAGLITSQRDRNRMVHTLTPLGRALLNHAS